jgi:hypothetical protein
MVNQATIAALESRPVPPDLQCYLRQETADAIAKTIRVTGLASQIASPSGVTQPVTNNISQQALDLAQENQERINTLEGNQSQKRIVAVRNNVPQGDSIQAYAISPAMPNDQYEVRVTLYGSSSHPTNYYSWRVQGDTVTANGFSVVYDNIPQGTLATVIVESLQSVVL